MGVVHHYFLSPYSFVMGVLWFNAFVLLGLLTQKLKFPIIFSSVPLLLLLVLSILRMFVAIELPGAVVVLSETLYPAIVNFFRIDIVSFRPFGLPVNIAFVCIFTWVAGAVWLTAKYAHEYVGRFPGLLRWYVTMPRDEHAESLLTEIIGNDKHFRVFRSKAFSTPVATAFKPFIILPKINFSDDELRVILLHEWKHIQDKDYLSGIIVNLISFVFWWNPVVYILKKNFRFAVELKNDQYAVSDENSFTSYLEGVRRVRDSEKKKIGHGLNALVKADDGLKDRILVLVKRDEMWNKFRHRQILTNAGYSIFIVALFFASYMLTVLPAHWESPYVPVTAENFRAEYREGGDVLRTEEIFLVDNNDGTFSYYVDGIFMMYVDADSNLLNWVEIRARESD
ncbi:MAG: M56 family metallopeptidase [Defluviitaleaceae bacterium]|nr:M56 family metallopeptidase [Defluviitaleaceae bacterium]